MFLSIENFLLLTPQEVKAKSKMKRTYNFQVGSDVFLFKRVLLKT